MEVIRSDLTGNLYLLDDELGEGSFGTVYKATEETSRKTVALKFSSRDLEASMALEFEILTTAKDLNFVGFPKPVELFSSRRNSVLVMELLRDPLSEALENYSHGNLVQTALKIADQLITRLENLHWMGYVHGDVKPDNILMDKSGHTLYLVDFGLSRRYIDPKTHMHIPAEPCHPIGSPYYMSINVLKNQRMSRRDDLESLAYLLAEVVNERNIPWISESGDDSNDTILSLKLETSPEELFNGQPREFANFLEEVRALEFDEEPNYSKYRAMFRRIGKPLGIAYGRDRIFY